MHRMCLTVVAHCVHTGVMTTRKATELRMLVEGETRPHDVLADGSHVLRVSVMAERVYVKALTVDGRFVTRRYARDKMVEVRA